MGFVVLVRALWHRMQSHCLTHLQERGMEFHKGIQQLQGPIAHKRGMCSMLPSGGPHSIALAVDIYTIWGSYIHNIHNPTPIATN